MSEPLSTNWYSRSDEYDVVIIGSGYGGAITARRIAEESFDNKPSICLLERGREWIPGLFPDEPGDVVKHLLTPLNPLGLYEFRGDNDVSVIQGSGLGGTSLVNANVAIAPESEVFDKSSWPANITAAMMKQYYDAASNGLGITKHPRGFDLPKIKALQKRANLLSGSKLELLDLTVNFDLDGVDPATGMERKPCTDCGDCLTGCNVLAKNTLYTNYLPLARKAGVEIFTQTTVSYLQENPTGGYLIHYERYSPRHRMPETGIIKANRAVIVSAGSFGSTEIMLRSRDKGLQLPDTLGTRFSGNGDFFGIAYNSDMRTDIMGFGNHPDDPPRSDVKAGPTIVGVIRYDRDKPLNQQITIEDLSIPRAGVDIARKVLGFISGAGKDTDSGIGDKIWELARIARDIRVDVKGAFNHTMVYLVMGFDDAGGAFELKNNKLKLNWPGVADQTVFDNINKELFQHAKAIGATFIGNPAWEYFKTRRLVTAHPLGGCPLGDTSATGLVDSKGNVFNGNGEKETHPGLFVADGSIIPSAVGVNPFLTISALSEHIASCVIEELK